MPGVVGEGAGEGDELLLAGGKGRRRARGTGLEEREGEGADELAYVDLVGCFFKALVCDAGGAEADVVGDGAGEEEGVPGGLRRSARGVS